MKKNLNIELNVRRMQAQDILTCSCPVDDTPTSQQWAPSRRFGSYGGYDDYDYEY